MSAVNESFQQEEESQDFLGVLDKLGSVGQGQIDFFRAKIRPLYRGIFDFEIPDDDKMICTFLDSLSDEELTGLVYREKATGLLVGIHEVGRHLHTLALLTGDERYGRIAKHIG